MTEPFQIAVEEDAVETFQVAIESVADEKTVAGI